MPPIVDSPLSDETPQPGDEMHVVMCLGINGGDWVVMRRQSDQSQMRSHSRDEAEGFLIEAKKHIAKHSSTTNIAAAGLRIFTSTHDEL
jgi:hypothetical protein